MDFIGSDGWPAPTLAKAKIDDPSQWQRLYIDVVHLLRDVRIYFSLYCALLLNKQTCVAVSKSKFSSR